MSHDTPGEDEHNNNDEQDVTTLQCAVVSVHIVESGDRAGCNHVRLEILATVTDSERSKLLEALRRGLRDVEYEMRSELRPVGSTGGAMELVAREHWLRVPNKP